MQFSFWSNRDRLSRLALVSLAIIFFVGCAAQGHRQDMDAFSEAWSAGDYRFAALGDKQPDDLTERDIERMDLLQLLHSAEALRLSGDEELALLLFDRTEEDFKRFDEENIAQRAAGQVGAVLVNESVRRYRGNLYEAILVNSYKGLMFLGLGEPDLARVEFNRADDRTRRAVEFFAKEIAADLEVLKKEAEEKQNSQAVNTTLESDDNQSIVHEAVGNPSMWEVYPDFVNPFVTYLHGLFFIAQSGDDVERAVQSFRRVDAMIDNLHVKADLEMAEALASGEISRDTMPPMVWVMFENGTGPTLSEARVDLPIFLYTQGRPNRPTLASLALPKIENGRPAARTLNIYGLTEGADIELSSTLHLSDMQRVVKTEFKQGFNGILTRAITSAVLNLAIQSELSGRAGLLGAIAATAYTASTTHADLRIWRALPAEWQLARFERPEEGFVRLSSEFGQEVGYITLPDWQSTLVYVKQPTSNSRPAIRIIDLSGQHLAINPEMPSSMTAEVQP